MHPLLFGGALGALVMYFLDPNLGRRRRARTRDKVVHAAKVVNEGAKVTARDTVHRAQGAWAEAKRLFGAEEPATDEVLVGRVRADNHRMIEMVRTLGFEVRRGEDAGEFEVSLRLRDA